MIMMMHDPFIHYHAFQRYDNVVQLVNVDWKDNNTLTNFASMEVLDDEILFKIRDYMK